jgi:hypothetical protein
MSGRSFGGADHGGSGGSTPRGRSWSRRVGKRKTLWVYFTCGEAKSDVLQLRP